MRRTTFGISIADERLFKPYMNGFEYDGVDKTVYDSIMKCNIYTRKGLNANIVLSGGNTMFPGFKERMEMEIVALTPPTMKVKVIALPDPMYSVWIGASIPTFPQLLITHDEYNDAGPSVVHRKYLI